MVEKFKLVYITVKLNTLFTVTLTIVTVMPSVL